MSIRDRRTSYGWTQEQLADHSGVSARTIQRAEQGKAATLETLKCLAAVLETDVSTLIKEQNMLKASADLTLPDLQMREREAIDYVQNVKWFRMHLLIFAVTLLGLAGLNGLVSPGVLWVVYVGAAWAIGLAIHAVMILGMFGLYGPEWEQRAFERRMGRRE